MRTIKKISIIAAVVFTIAVMLSVTALADGLFVLDGFPGVSDENSFYRNKMAAQGEKIVWLYDNLIDTVKNQGKSLNLTSSSYKFSSDEVISVTSTILKQYYGDYAYGFSLIYIGNGDQKYCVSINPRYNDGYYGDYYTRFVSESAALLEEAGITKDNVNSLSAREKAFRIHDVLIDHIDYSDNSDGIFGIQRDQTAYSGIVDGRTVCAGYARAFQFLMTQCGVETLYVSGTAADSYGSSGHHAWNLVKEDEGWYFVDVTWDDPIGGSLSYKYFNLSLNSIKADHFAEPYSPGYPSTPETDGWNPTKDPDYNHYIYQSDTDDWYISYVYGGNEGGYYKENDGKYTVSYADRVIIMIEPGPGCDIGDEMQVYINGKLCSYENKGFYISVKYSCREDVRVAIEGIKKAEEKIYGNAVLKEDGSVLSIESVNLPEDVYSYYIKWIVDGEMSEAIYEESIDLSDYNPGQTLQLLAWTDDYSGYIKSEVYLVSERRIVSQGATVNDFTIGMIEKDGYYSFHFNYLPEEWSPIWVGAYSSDGRFIDVVMLVTAEDFKLKTNAYEMRFFSIGDEYSPTYELFNVQI